ncbi:glucose/arabinose dehydrogenase [Caulobacter ginsengisoli]|uniref:Glucose/arabinose dehydrogenase n=1 Tax=Caulobacter ginsengisoli TaxID=400775 RepID=A0ABU0IN51_9CAUL|nr:PQQ-dependent sugar dehydrogenase [Caulobacter ginsengisoli]MDQ0463437.1 glucose/arabinose dehydrogenase [Caulobacter ginsengisoli]
MRPAPAVFALLLLAACGAPPSVAQTPGQPLETRSPNAPDQKPAFPGQTRAPFATAKVAFDVVPVAKGLDHPWGMAFLPDGRLLVTERAGRLRIVGKDGALSAPVAGLPPVDARGQGGLLDVAAGPDGLIYWTYSEPREGGNGTAAARGRLSADGAKMEAVQVIWRQTPTLDSTLHFGGRLVFAPDGKLFITTGERSILPGRHQAERLDGTLGKVVRINPDGGIPADNPFVGKADAKGEIWSLGHRNIQAGAINPATGRLWTIEHGARGGDEINAPLAGRDYGWPTITYGTEYSGAKVGGGITQKAGLEQPLYYWDPVIAPSGMAFYNSDLFPAWKGSLFVGSLKDQQLVRLTLDGEKIVGEERLLTDLKERIRDVIVGPDGSIYVSTDDSDGRVLKLVPKS